MTSRQCSPALMLILLAGCQTMPSASLKGLSDSLAITKKDDQLKDSAYETPVRVIAIWSDAMYTQPGAPPTRGFGGRLYFYNAKDKPVPVEGQLVVYAFDESQGGDPVQTPSRKFGFTPEQFTQHYSPTELGASYSIWIPWDGVGGVRRSISLLPVFTSSSGQVVMGEQSINILPGKAPEVQEPRQSQTTTPQEREGSRRITNVQAPALPGRDTWQQTHTYEPNAGPETRLRATTIPLPMDMTRRLAQSTDTGDRQLSPPTSGNGPAATAPAPKDNGVMAAAPEAPAEPPPAATRFVRPRSPALRAPIARPGPARETSLPPPAGSQPAPPSPPSPQPGSLTAGSAPTDPGPASWVR